MKWQSIHLPNGKQTVIPSDIPIRFIEGSRLTPHQLCATAFIPWQSAYLELVPRQYQPFFRHVMPYLGKRTTDVHTALSVSQLPFLLKHSQLSVDSRLVYLATILHDTGWSRVSERGIANSLSYSGVSPTSSASALPKQQHVLIGVALAYDLLDTFDFGDKPVFEGTKRHVAQIIRRHDYDAAWDKGKFPRLSAETKLVCDADRLWSYTHENFWQDTIRKDVRPDDYLVTISGAIEGYFITAQAKVRAHGLIAERRKEVEAYSKHLQLARTTV